MSGVIEVGHVAEAAAAIPSSAADSPPKYRFWKYNATFTRPISTGTLNQRANDRGEGRTGIDSEDGDGNGYRQFKVVAGCRERNRGCLRVVSPDLSPHPEAHEEHHHEVDEKRNGDPQHVQRNLNNEVPLEAEHDEDGEQQSDQRERTDRRNELPLVLFPTLGLQHDEASRHACKERDAEIDEYASGDFADADFDGVLEARTVAAGH